MTLPRDENRVPFNTDQIRSVTKEYDFGSESVGAGTAVVFSVTGEVLVKVFGVCSQDLAGTGGSASIGFIGATEALIPKTLITDIDAGELWFNELPVKAGTAFTNVSEILVVGGSDIIIEAAGTAISGGNLTIHCLYKPVSKDGKVE